MHDNINMDSTITWSLKAKKKVESVRYRPLLYGHQYITTDTRTDFISVINIK